MNIDARLQSLGQRHQELENRLTEEMQRPSSDDIKLHDLKRRKLAIKDEMSMLEAQRHSQ